MQRLTVLGIAAAALAVMLGGTFWNTSTFAKTKGGCSDSQVCCRYLKDGTTEMDCMDAKSCTDKGGKEIPDKTKCAE